MELLPENGSPVTSNTKDYKSQRCIMAIGLKGLIDTENGSQVQMLAPGSSRPPPPSRRRCVIFSLSAGNSNKGFQR